LRPRKLPKQVQAAIRSPDSGQAGCGVMTMDERIADSVTEPRFDTLLTGAFSLLAVAIAAAGMYSRGFLSGLAVTLAAAYLPMRRGCRLDSAVAVRCE
jgi:hypothetical protein